MLHVTATSFDSYQRQSGYGTPASGSSRQFGTGSGEMNKQGNNIKSRLPGSFALAFIKGGGATSAWTFNFDYVHDLDPIKLIQRTNNLLDYFTVHSGWNELATDLGWHCQDCLANQLTLRLAGGDSPGPLTGSISGFGRQITQNTITETPTDPPAPPFLAYEAFFTLGGAPCELDSFDLTVNNNIRPHWVIAGAARTGTAVRFWDYQIPGNLDVTGTLVMLEPWTYDVHQNCLPASQNAILRLVNVCTPSQVFQVTLGGIVFDEEQQRIPSDGGPQLYSYPFTAKTVAFAAV